MISYKKANIVSMYDLENFLVAKGYNPKIVWDAFADEVENDSYNYWDLDMLQDAIDVAEYSEQPDKIAIYNCVIEAIHNGEILEEFLLNVCW